MAEQDGSPRLDDLAATSSIDAPLEEGQFRLTAKVLPYPLICLAADA
jgi:hypothetical protein